MVRLLVAVLLGASIAAAAQPASFDDELRRGLLALQNNQLPEAKQSLERASQLQPANPKVWIALAQAYLRSQQTVPANAAAKRAEVLAGNDPLIQHGLAIFYSETGDFAKAAEMARHDEGFTFDLGQGMLHRGDFEGALGFFDKARSRFPKSAQIELAYGVAAYGQRRFADAIDAFLGVIRIDPSVEQPYVFLARLLDQAGDRLGEITAAYAAWEKAAPRNCLPVCLHAKALSAAGGDAAEIEAELDHLSPEELRRLALKSWTTFVTKEAGADGGNECDEPHPGLLTALDEALARADATPGQGFSGREVRNRLNEWTSK